jgi:plasmid stabilization system protein ParE
MTVHFSPKAESDFQLAEEWYEDQQEGLGQEFFNELNAVVEAISIHPKLFQVRYKDVRVGYLNRFPFVVHYRSDHQRLTIIAVFHTSLAPKHWKGR